MRAKEKSCGELNHFIPDARACALRHNHSPDDFGSITGGINLWWGEKHTGGMLNNPGYVIGLRNPKADIGWRLDKQRSYRARSEARADSPAKEDGFEPPVPLGSNTSVSTSFAGWRCGRSLFKKAPRLRGTGSSNPSSSSGGVGHVVDEAVAVPSNAEHEQPENGDKTKRPYD